jgi:hypothetical protein
MHLFFGQFLGVGVRNYLFKKKRSDVIKLFVGHLNRKDEVPFFWHLCPTSFL